MKIYVWLFIGGMVVSAINAQKPVLEVLTNGNQVSLRGLSVVNDSTIWASGSNGSIARSVDGGRNWQWMQVPGHEKRDFRDIEAFDANTAIIMGIAEPAVILKTIDGGHTWKKVFEDSTKGMFLDAMAFSGDKGVVVGDPVNQYAYLAVTRDRGNTWQKSNLEGNPHLLKAREGEAFFASSGTNVQYFTKKPGFVFVSGGNYSGLYYLGRRFHLPFGFGVSTAGANSLAISPDNQHAVVVGGNFSIDTARSRNSVLVSFEKEGVTMKRPQTPPLGYRSCVIYLDKQTLLTCGTSGVDVSRDGGKNWNPISTESYHVCQKAKSGKAVFLAGKNGRIARWVLP